MYTSGPCCLCICNNRQKWIKRGLDTSVKNRAINGYWSWLLCTTSRFSGSFPLNINCMRACCRGWVFFPACELASQPVGHCRKQTVELDRPLASSSKAIMFNPAQKEHFQASLIGTWSVKYLPREIVQLEKEFLFGWMMGLCNYSAIGVWLRQESKVASPRWNVHNIWSTTH